MHILKKISKEKTTSAYWKSILGEELFLRIQSEPEYETFLEQGSLQNQKELKEFLRPLSKEEEQKEREEWVFYPFYYRTCCYTRRKLDEVFRQRHLISVTEKTVQNLAWQYVKEIQGIPLRCLLQEMGELKQEQRLQGKNEREEYQFYLKEYLGKEEFLLKMAEKYPVMMDLIFRKTEAFVFGLEEMLSCLEQEKKQIEKFLCQGKIIRNICQIESGLSDEHSLGKTVTRLEFDNKSVVYYKPRSLKPEQEYHKLYHWICGKCGLENYDRGILDCGTHGWEQEATVVDCMEEEEVWRYYERMGIHLCLTYLFGVSDIHFENIIACGEYPILIDMEVFPGYQSNDKQENTSLQGLLQNSVLSTGILPGQIWGNAMVNVSALGSIREQKSSFQIPVIKKKNTSNMHIAYDYGRLKSSDCIPGFKGQKVDASQFIDAVQNGFHKAYESIMVYREEITERIRNSGLWKSRCVIRHTQQYKMYQMTASFPEFMAEPEARRLMLLRMDKGLHCLKEHRKTLLFYEAETVMQECFPVYYIKGRDLELGNGTCISNYFEETVQEQVIERLRRMNAKDKYRQQKFIALAVSAGICQNTEKKQKIRGVRKKENTYNEKQSVTIRKIAEQLQKDAEAIEGETQWISLGYGEECGWRFKTMGMYLYDGIAGIAVFLMAYGCVYGMDEYREMRESVLQQMFSYTDRGITDIESLESRHTGIMNGESSVVYTYLVLYHISREKRFLEYARKHIRIVGELLEEDKNFDILEGNAGAVIALVHMYQETGENHYLEMAKHTADILLKHMVQKEKGAGWLIPGQKQPLAGFAHGNSGIMLAFARLWKLTGIPRYHEIIVQAREYEDSLYDEEIENWRDIRGIENGHGRDVTAWCHGAAGILIAAVHIDQILGVDPAEDWRVQRAEKKVHKTRKEQCCLCHGRMGNAAALRFWNLLGKQEQSGDLEYLEYHQIPEWEKIHPKEKYQMGFMTGLSGIGYELLKREEKRFPEILALELQTEKE